MVRPPIPWPIMIMFLQSENGLDVSFEKTGAGCPNIGFEASFGEAAETLEKQAGNPTVRTCLHCSGMVRCRSTASTAMGSLSTIGKECLINQSSITARRHSPSSIEVPPAKNRKPVFDAYTTWDASLGFECATRIPTNTSAK